MHFSHNLQMHTSSLCSDNCNFCPCAFLQQLTPWLSHIFYKNIFCVSVFPEVPPFSLADCLAFGVLRQRENTPSSSYFSAFIQSLINHPFYRTGLLRCRLVCVPLSHFPFSTIPLYVLGTPLLQALLDVKPKYLQNGVRIFFVGLQKGSLGHPTSLLLQPTAPRKPFYKVLQLHLKEVMLDLAPATLLPVFCYSDCSAELTPTCSHADVGP